MAVRPRSARVIVAPRYLSHSAGSAVRPSLKLKKFCVGSAGRNEVGVTARLDDAAIGQDEDDVGHTNRAEPVADQHRDAASFGRRPLGGTGEAPEQFVLARASKAAVGSSRSRSRGASRIMERPRASFCHWPPESSTPPGNVRPTCVRRPSGRLAGRSAPAPRRRARSIAGTDSRSGR